MDLPTFLRAKTATTLTEYIYSVNYTVDSHLEGRSVLFQSVAYLGDNWSV